MLTRTIFCLVGVMLFSAVGTSPQIPLENVPGRVTVASQGDLVRQVRRAVRNKLRHSAGSNEREQGSHRLPFASGFQPVGSLAAAQEIWSGSYL